MTPNDHSPNGDLTSHWILLRGLARESRHWGAFPEKLRDELAKLGDTARVDAIDLPGTGRYSEMKSPLSVGEMTEFAREKFNEIRKAMRARGEIPPERTRILAVSLGGMIAADWIERWPKDFAEAVFINTSFKSFSPVHHRLKPSAVIHLLSHLRRLPTVERELLSLKLVSNRTDIIENKSVAAEWSKFADERPVSLENFSRQLFAASSFKAPSQPPTLPLLVVYSEHDRMVDPRCSQEIIRRWNTAQAVHKTAGHDLTLDDPNWVIGQALAWERGLKEVPLPETVAAGG